MSRYLKIGILGLVLLIVIMQFVGADKPEVSFDNPQDIFKVEVVDSEVEKLIKNACYDCHSLETKYPWYSNVAPVSWLIYDHILHGRDELNFSYWGTLEKRKKIRKLKDIGEEIAEKKMPLDDYVKLHPEADMTPEQKKMLVEWSKSLAGSMFSN